jgi:AmmeMemoRadiSam system protein A
MVILGALAPHPPIIVPAVGRERLDDAAATREAMARLAEIFAGAAPETIVLFTPHGNVFQDVVAVMGLPELRGGLAQFGDDETQVWANDLELAEEIVGQAARAGLAGILFEEDDIRRYNARAALDHGALVPLSFMGPVVRRAKLVVVGMGFLPLEDLYLFGLCVAKAAEKLGRKTIVLASGDLSHRLTPDAPAGYDPAGGQFDRQLVELLGRADVRGVMGIDPVLAEKAGECGYRTIVMMLGALDGRDVKAEILSYEGPFGVGYAVGSFYPLGPDPARAFHALTREDAAEAMMARRRDESPLAALARETVEAHVNGKPLPEGGNLPPEAEGRAGVFVSIKKRGQLRGCIGTTAPTRPSMAEEIRANAIAASTRDPRFEPVRPDELPELVYSVDILGAAEPVDGMEGLDPERYGVIVKRGARRGLLLPNLEGVETAGEQVAIARRKAGIGPGEEIQLERFEVVRYH